MDGDYISDVSKKLEDARKRLGESVAAGQFLANKEAKVAIDIISNQLTDLITKAFSDKKPLTFEQYLSTYGKVTALRGFMMELQGKADQNVVLNEQVKMYDDQIKAAQGIEE